MKSVSSCCFYSLFPGCSNISDCSSLTLPATTLASDCYSGMFSGCSNLITAPALPATTLADRCYRSMFSGCIKLTQVPNIKTYTPNLDAFSYMLCAIEYSTLKWGQLTTCIWNDLTIAEVERMILNDEIFGSGASVRISITCKDGSGTAYFDSENYSWVFEH